MEIPIANIYYLLCYAWEALEEKDMLAEVGRAGRDGFARALRAGSDEWDAPPAEAGTGPGLSSEGRRTGRGARQAPDNADPPPRLDSPGRAACAWDELEYDTLPNRILKATFQKLHAEETLDGRARAGAGDMLRWLAPVQGIKLRAADFRRVQLHRNNRIYSLLLHVCEFIHEHWLPEERGKGRLFREFVRDRLSTLFEKFVRNFYLAELPVQEEWAVSAPTFGWRVTGANADAEALLPRMATDVCLARSGRAIILDTKFYAEALKSNAYGAERLSSANFYQLFTYLRQRAHEPGWENAEGVLLYPRTTRDFDAEFTTHGHRMRALTLDLARPWREIHAALLSIAVQPSKMHHFNSDSGMQKF